MKLFLFFSCLLLLSCAQSNSQKKSDINVPNENDLDIGGPCEGCEAIYESAIAFEALNNTDTLPDWKDQGERILLTGTIFIADGKTPAENVIVYVYHTDQKGEYPKRGDEKGWGKRHGYLRGWVRTGKDGSYSFYTLRPASYPNSNNPQHVHVTIKEPGKKEYWIDEFQFDDDPYLTAQHRSNARNRGGNGIIRLSEKEGIKMAKRDIVLGMNVEN